MCCKLIQSKKVDSEIDLMFASKDKCCNWEHPANASGPIVVTLDGI